MHINVSHILAGEVGDEASYRIEGESVPDLVMPKPAVGEVKITRLDNGLALRGQVEVVLSLECYRCLDSYQQPLQLNLTGTYSLQPGEDDWPISPRGEIDVTPLVRQEALVMIPLKQLCSPDCLGLCVDCGQKLHDGHKHSQPQLQHRPRINPSTKHGVKKGT